LRNEIQENAAMKKNEKWSILKGFGLMFKFLGLVVIVALLAPIGYFAWRAGQPMSMPEYDGRTYYELLTERWQAYDRLAQEYQASHPNVEVKNGMCFQTELAVSFANTLPWAVICTASEFVPVLKIYGPKSQRMGCGQMGGSLMDFPSTMWRTYEKLLYMDILKTRPQGPVQYCRISVP
jgi:hypothetical protein